ncbi:flagellar assembly protein FliW [Paenibacillus sp. DCT19]|uniref:flagellar assembly protein FliW n=1 Tax=Paenibacillus sp. DCT19 TaxID=2211212 RepID=UPI000FE1B0F8|nr:flagellar assembly protein FliW [Paenibacillus sp. DCT19]
MKIQTSMWGEIEVQEEVIYSFSKGLPGFDDEHQFALIPWEDTPFVYLQSLQQSELSFLLVNPFLFSHGYSFELPEADREELEIRDQVEVYSMVTIHTQVNRSTMNLLAPVVLNPENRTGKQVVLHQSGYETRCLIWPEEQLESAKGGV